MPSGLSQHFHHPRTAKASTEKLSPALKKLEELEDPEAEAIIAPLLEDHTIITAPVLKECDMIRSHAKYLIVLGSGGSGLSGKTLAAIHTKPTEYHLHVLDSCDLYDAETVMRRLKPEETALLVISKSGTTVETLCYLDLFQNWLQSTQDIHERITVITMTNENALHQQAKQQGWRIIPHAKDLCGRFSIFSAVGLLPAAFVGVDIHALLKGAKAAWLDKESALQSTLFQYDALNYGLGVHVTFAYGKRFVPLVLWWRQGIAESLGKRGKGLYPISAQGPCDQHSQLQLFLDGNPLAMFTLLTEESKGRGAKLGKETLLSMLQEKQTGDVIQAQQMATLETLKNADKSIRHLQLESHDPEVIGAILMQWIKEIILLGYMLGINPFDQPAVEESKRLTREYLK